MRLGGLQKMTLLDFPGRVACTVFTLGCNFRCPFCHNAMLVTGTDGAETEFSQEELFSFLEKRRGLLDGVAITGGEPLLHQDIGDFIRRIRALGYPVKLDTNGAFPERLRALIDEGLVDYVAVDIKNSREKYGMTIGFGDGGRISRPGRTDMVSRVEQTVALLLENRVPYEFRTTLVDELHEVGDFDRIGQWIAGAERYFIQGFVDSGAILGGEDLFHAASKEKAKACLEAVRPYVPQAELRGQES